MASSAHLRKLHLIALDVEAASSICALPTADRWEIHTWDDVEGFAAWAASDEAEGDDRIRVAVAVATADEVDIQGVRSLHVLPRCIDVLVVVRMLDRNEHENLLKTGVGRVEAMPLPPLRPDVLFHDRSYLTSLFPGCVVGRRRERHEFEVESRPENVPAVVRVLCERCDELGHPNDFVRSQLPLVADEAITNGMKHGNRWVAEKTVFVAAEITSDRVEIIVTDQGEGFARDDVHDPLHADRRGVAGGRGLFLIESIMDEVHYEDGGRTIAIVKRIESAVSTA